MEQNETTLFKLEVEGASVQFLSETAKWAKFLSIMGFITTGIIVIFALFAGVIFKTAFASLGNSGMGSGVSVLISFVYIAFALLYFFPCLYMFRFSTKMQTALAENNQLELTNAFENLKSAFKFVGIMTIVILALYALVFIVGIGAAAFTR